ncbi:hypothetical protein M6B38_133880 [Iris pallida]|uniref:Uncharacterized protein n=1 Tax=Iris pallida TaxID=29817 RepID=A0AAX6FGP2_IRIPA|nr:hypothetical protein M6B38_133880 [Iris pallida]
MLLYKHKRFIDSLLKLLTCSQHELQPLVRHKLIYTLLYLCCHSISSFFLKFTNKLNENVTMMMALES